MRESLALRLILFPNLNRDRDDGLLDNVVASAPLLYNSFPLQCRGEVVKMFDWKRPLLKDSALSGEELGKCLQRCAFNETLMRLVHQGEHSAKLAISFAEGLLKKLGGHASKSADPVLEAACEVVKDVAKWILMVASIAEVEEGVLDGISQAKAGMRQLLKHSVSQVPYWKEKERMARHMMVASRTLGPELDEVLPKVPDMTLDELAVLAKRFPVFEEGLGEGRFSMSTVACKHRTRQYRQK